MKPPVEGCGSQCVLFRIPGEPSSTEPQNCNNFLTSSLTWAKYLSEWKPGYSAVLSVKLAITLFISTGKKSSPVLSIPKLQSVNLENSKKFNEMYFIMVRLNHNTKWAEFAKGFHTHMDLQFIRAYCSSGSGGPRGPCPSPGDAKINHKKDGRQRRPHRFHVSCPAPYPAAGSATLLLLASVSFKFYNQSFYFSNRFRLFSTAVFAYEWPIKHKNNIFGLVSGIWWS